MRHRLLVVLALCAAALAAGPAAAADVAPLGRWVATGGGARTILSLFSDASYQLTSVKGDEPPAVSIGTYVAKDGHLALSAKGQAVTDFTYVVGKGQLTLGVAVEGTRKELTLARDNGPVVGTWHSDKVDTTWALAADGSMEGTEGGATSTSRYEVAYVEPGAVEGNLLIHKEGSPTLSYHFTVEEKGMRLVLGGGPQAQDPTLRIPLERVGAAPEMPATPTAPATPPANGAPKRAKFPAPPKLPGGGGTAPVQPTAPVAPTPGATPPPAPDAPAAPPPAADGPVWDTAQFAAKGFKILKSTYDPDGSKMSWVLEATKDITAYPSIRVNFYDADDIKIWDSSISLSPSLVSKGEKVRAELSLPYREKMKNVVKVVLVPG